MASVTKFKDVYNLQVRLQFRSASSNAKQLTRRMSVTYRIKDNGEDPNENLQELGYQYGVPVRLGLLSGNESVYFSECLSSMTFPRRSVNGQCSWLSPIRFLISSSDVCNIRILPTSCSSDVRLNARMYSAGFSGQNSGAVLQVIAKNGMRTAVSRVHFRFLCLTAGANMRPKRCKWDDGMTAPPAPTIQSSICRNVVVSVMYRFVWSGQQILSLEGIVTVTDVKLDNTETGVQHSQKFEVMFEAAGKNTGNLLTGDGNQLNSTDSMLSSVADRNLNKKRLTEYHVYRPLPSNGVYYLFSNI
jgi:hypothetical protein